MKDQVVMSPNNAELAIAIPLYRHHYDEALESLDGVTISLTVDKPIVYGLDLGSGKIHPFNAEWVEKHLEFLGDL